MLTEIPQVKYIRYMSSHNSGNIHGENLHIWTKKIFSRKIEYIFTKKLHHNYKNILGYKIRK